jgi:plasmid stabilization system protein ParE
MNLYQLLISSDAEADIEDAVKWYRNIGSGLESEFIRALEACLSSIRRNPALYPVVYKNVRRALVRKFPYGVFYFVFEDTVVVLACFHTKRDPKDWQSRV